MSETTSQMSEGGTKLLFCSFYTGGNLFGIRILDVKEVTSEVAITPVFHAAPEVRGYVNIRGQIHLVLDFRMLLGFSAGQSNQSKDSSNCVILLKPHVGEAFGLLVDSVGDVIETDSLVIEENLSQPQSGETVKYRSDIIKSVCKLDKGLMGIIDASEILKIVEKDAVSV